MDMRLPDISALLERPHLATVAILQTALEMTLRILSANYPNLAEYPEPSFQPEEEDAYVDAVFHQAYALQALLRSYNDAVERRLQLRRIDAQHPQGLSS